MFAAEMPMAIMDLGEYVRLHDCQAYIMKKERAIHFPSNAQNPIVPRIRVSKKYELIIRYRSRKISIWGALPVANFKNARVAALKMQLPDIRTILKQSGRLPRPC